MLNEILIITGVVSLISAVIAGTVLARRITRPLVKTMEATKEIADGNYRIRFESSTGMKELSELTRSVNHMAQSLDEQEKLRRISGLVADMESLRQLEDEKMVLEKEPLNLLEIAGAVKQSFEREASERGLEMVVLGEAAVISGDRKRLHQAVYNLVSNAVKYTGDRGKVTITVRRTEQGASISVEDSGIGIVESELPFIFERFYRTDSSRSRKTGGSGIGLTIVKAIVKAHNGNIEVTSRQGKGSCFTVTLPEECREAGGK